MKIRSWKWFGTGRAGSVLAAGVVLTALTGCGNRESAGDRLRSGPAHLRRGFGGAVLVLALAACGLAGCASSSRGAVEDTSPSTGVTSPSLASSAVAGASGSSGAVAPVAQGLAGCANLVATPTLKAALARVEGKRRGVVHLETAPGHFFYGRCDNDEYAGGWFRLTAGATEREKVQMQDENAGAFYFTRQAHGSWRYVATSGVDPIVGCTKLSAIPHPLAQLWNDCPIR